MCLQKLMNIHHCVFKVLEKTASRADTRTDNLKTVVYPASSPPPPTHTHTNKVCRGILIETRTILDDVQTYVATGAKFKRAEPLGKKKTTKNKTKQNKKNLMNFSAALSSFLYL